MTGAPGPRRLAGWAARARRAGTVLVATPLFVLLSAGAASASAKFGSTPPALGWIKLLDTRGISVWNYEMSLDRGGVRSPGKVIWSFQIDLFWQIYRAGVVIAVWAIDWVLGFDWLAKVAAPVLVLSRNLQSLVAQFGLTPALLTVAAAVAVLWMAKGRWALGLFELLLSLVIAAFAAGVLANPVGQVVGPGGVILQSRDFGMQVAGKLSTDGSQALTADQLRAHTTGMLIDTFVRMPAEMLNFGAPLDGGKCQKAYDAAVKAGPYGTGAQIRTAVGRCDKNLGAVAANPGSGQAVSGLIISPAALFVLLFAIVLAGTVLLAALSALYQSLRAIVTLVLGVLPGQARGGLWLTAADLAMSLVMLVFAVVFLTGYLLVLQAVFTGSSAGSGGVMATFFFVDVLLLAGVLLFWRGRKTLRRTSERLAAALATRPQGGPTRLPDRGRGLDPTALYYKTRMASIATRRAGDAASALSRPVAASGRTMLGESTVSARQVAGGARKAGRRWLATLGAQTAFAVASGGATAATGAAIAASTRTASRAASRALLLGRLNGAPTPPPPSGRGGRAGRGGRITPAGGPDATRQVGEWQPVRHGGHTALVPTPPVGASGAPPTPAGTTRAGGRLPARPAARPARPARPDGSTVAAARPGRPASAARSRAGGSSVPAGGDAAGESGSARLRAALDARRGQPPPPPPRRSGPRPPAAG